MQSLELIGLCKAQKIGNSLYLVIPSQEAQELKIEQGREFTIYYDADTKSFHYKPKEVSA